MRFGDLQLDSQCMWERSVGRCGNEMTQRFRALGFLSTMAKMHAWTLVGLLIITLPDTLESPPSHVTCRTNAGPADDGEIMAKHF